MGYFDPAPAAGKLLEILGMPGPDQIVPLPGGRNNQVWRVQSQSRRFLLKHYYWSETDQRDRLGHEWSFLEYLWNSGCRLAPQPLATMPEDRCSLLEYIEGVSFTNRDVSRGDVQAAIIFFSGMNAHPELASDLPPVSEACFSLDAHLSTTANRVTKLASIQPESDIHSAAIRFVTETIRPLWQIVETSVRTKAGESLTEVLPHSHRCLSPSDFGFHNALRESDGRLRFVDFEYAGWDDPAKTLIDFCNQPDRLLPASLANEFLAGSAALFPNPQELQRRIAILEPVYQLKWACICLNNFLPGRAFPNNEPDRSAESQLTRSRTMAARAADRMKSGK